MTSNSEITTYGGPKKERIMAVPVSEAGPAVPAMYTAQQVADAFGMPVARVHKERKSGRLHGRRPLSLGGGTYYFFQQDIDRWIATWDDVQTFPEAAGEDGR